MKRYVRWTMGLLCLLMLGCVNSLFTLGGGEGTPKGQPAANGVPEIVNHDISNTWITGMHAEPPIFCGTRGVEDGHIVVECENDTKRKHNLSLDNYWSPPKEEAYLACGADGAVETKTGPIPVAPGKTITVRIPIPSLPFTRVSYCAGNVSE